jgi:hypothetical protein
VGKRVTMETAQAKKREEGWLIVATTYTRD